MQVRPRVPTPAQVPVQALVPQSTRLQQALLAQAFGRVQEAAQALVLMLELARMQGEDVHCHLAPRGQTKSMKVQRVCREPLAPVMQVQQHCFPQHYSMDCCRAAALDVRPPQLEQARRSAPAAVQTSVSQGAQYSCPRAQPQRCLSLWPPATLANGFAACVLRERHVASPANVAHAAVYVRLCCASLEGALSAVLLLAVGLLGDGAAMQAA